MVLVNFIAWTGIFPLVCGAQAIEITSWQQNRLDTWILSKPLFSKLMTKIFLEPVFKSFIVFLLKVKYP